MILLSAFTLNLLQWSQQSGNCLNKVSIKGAIEDFRCNQWHQQVFSRIQFQNLTSNQRTTLNYANHRHNISSDKLCTWNNNRMHAQSNDVYFPYCTCANVASDSERKREKHWCDSGDQFPPGHFIPEGLMKARTHSTAYTNENLQVNSIYCM